MTREKSLGEHRRLRVNLPYVLYFLYEKDEIVSEVQEEAKKKKKKCWKTNLIRIRLMDVEKALNILAKARNRISAGNYLGVLFIFHQFYS